ncbi:prepilin-type N-terminal cleavage/methylation domain-containing protein [Isosphaeraceae bacterium EP7]
MTHMTHHPRMGRRGITLIEILISILIMGVGLVSLATLFPLGLLRLRDAARNSRSGLLAESATADIKGRNLLNKQSFLDASTCPWYYGSANTLYNPAIPIAPYDPWLEDGPAPPVGNGINLRSGGNYGPGLPVCYDPFWLAITGYYGSANPNNKPARFAQGTDLQSQPDSIGGRTASAHGLQRITNFSVDFPTVAALGTGVASWQTLQNIFVSPDDIVFNSLEDANKPGGASSTLPDLTPTTPGGPLEMKLDYAYSWFFTGHQSDITNDSCFVGDLVVCNNRPFGVETIGGFDTATGETVVEGIFGYSTPVIDSRHAAAGVSFGYAPRSSRTVLLRWPAGMPDPEVRVGGWIADVTYERLANNEAVKLSEALRMVTADIAYNAGLTFPRNPIALTPLYGMQRCHWYRIVRKSVVEDEIPNTTRPPAVAGYRRMTVVVGSELQSLTIMDAAGNPAHVNAALVMPSVVNVFPRSFNTH